MCRFYDNDSITNYGEKLKFHYIVQRSALLRKEIEIGNLKLDNIAFATRSDAI